MKILDMAGKVYDAETAKRVAQQLADSDRDGWKYIAKIQGKFGRVAVYDDTGAFVGYF